MGKRIIFGSEAKEMLMKGVDKIADSVKITLGPGGRNVMLDHGGMHGIEITKDGVTVARNLSFDDPVENMAAQLFKRVADSTDINVGDGTTTATVLAQAILKKGIELLPEVNNMQQFMKGMDDCKKLLIDELDKRREKIDLATENGVEKLRHISLVSSNNDKEISDLILEAMALVSADGVFRIEGGKYRHSFVEKKYGLSYDMGMVSPFMVTNAPMNEFEGDNCKILICGDKIDSLLQLKKILGELYENEKSSRSPLLIIAKEYSKEAIATALKNVALGLPICMVKAPGFGNEQVKYLIDLAVATDGKVIMEDLGVNISQCGVEVLGSAKKILVNFEKFTIIDGAGKEDEIQKRLKEIREEYDTETDGYHKDRNNERYAKLSSGVAVIHIGSYSDIELYEKKYRTDDALKAVRSAVKDGYLPGGGTTFYLLSNTQIKSNVFTDKSYLAGMETVLSALKVPLLTLFFNVGIPVPEKIRSGKFRFGQGYDLRTLDQCDMIERGIIDPYMVQVMSLTYAISIAKTILTTEAVIYNKQAYDPNKEDGYLT